MVIIELMLCTGIVGMTLLLAAHGVLTMIDCQDGRQPARQNAIHLPAKQNRATKIVDTDFSVL